MIPPGFQRCPACGEFNGETEARYLNWGFRVPEPHERVRVTCLCNGIPCGRCGVNKVHRPISNSYEEETNTVGHWFYLAGLIPCGACKQAEAEA